MNYRVSRIGIVRAGLVSAALYLLMALLFVPFLVLGSAAQAVGGSPGFAVMSLGMILFGLIVYPVMGFIAGVLFAAVYNLVAYLTGGLIVRIEAEDAEPEAGF